MTAERSKQPVGFAIVGCGMIAAFHVHPGRGARSGGWWPWSAGNSTGLRNFASNWAAIAIYDNLPAALARPDVQAVIVTTPSGAHLEPAVAAAQAGKHVVVEKPLEITLERCDGIIQACEQNNVKLCTIFPSQLAMPTAPSRRRWKRVGSDG